MKSIAVYLAFVLTSCLAAQVEGAPNPAHGYARYEIFGMLDENEKMARSLDSDTIETFYSSEITAANHFEALLGEFCAENSLPKKWHRQTTSGGHIEFIGREISAMLDRYYPQTRENRDMLDELKKAGELQNIPREGTLNTKVFRDASQADMLRYVVGAYIRHGDDSASRLALFDGANRDFSRLADVLSRLGCSEIRIYNNYDSGMVPTSFRLIFHPTEKIKALTGIQREISQKELNELINSGFKEMKKRPVL